MSHNPQTLTFLAPSEQRIQEIRNTLPKSSALLQAVRPFRVLLIDDLEDAHREMRRVLTPRANPVDQLKQLRERIKATNVVSLPSLAAQRFSLDSAFTGTEGVALAQTALSENTPFDVIIVDMQMPGIDGSETIRLLREIDKSTPIIICSAYRKVDRETLDRYNTGAPPLQVMLKPYTSEQLRGALHALQSTEESHPYA